MDFVLGIVVGIVATILSGAIAFWFVLRQSAGTPIPEPQPIRVQPALTVMMIEPFLNQQLRAALTNESGQVQSARVPFNLKLNDAALDVQPGRRAHFTAQFSASALGLQVSVRPTADLFFLPQAGRVRISVANVQIGGFALPRALIDRFVNQVVESAEAKLNHFLNQLQQDTGVQLAEIETTDDLLILSFAESGRVMPTMPPALENVSVAGGGE